MRLCVIRHGIAIDRNDPACPPDPERYLTKQGRDRTQEAARGLRALELKPDALLTSPYLRARQTAEIVAKALDMPVDTFHVTDALLPWARPEELFRELRRLDAGCVACFGHAPNVDGLIAYALGLDHAATSLKKAGAALLTLETLSPPWGALEWLMPARALRRLGS